MGDFELSGGQYISRPLQKMSMTYLWGKMKLNNAALDYQTNLLPTAGSQDPGILGQRSDPKMVIFGLFVLKVLVHIRTH